MRFGFMEDFRNPAPWRRPEPELYRAILDQIRAAEAAGYDDVWLTEHHFTRDGYNPSLLPTAAAVAAVTERIRIGTFILLMPFQHPVRVAEDVTLVDIVSNGRFDLGLGQGYSANEFETFCIPRKERSARTAEGAEIVRRLWTEDEVTVEGKFTRLHKATLSPKPVQKPHPPIWIGARTEKATRRAARDGHHLMATIGPDPAPWYQDELRKAGRNPDDFHVAQLRMVYVAETEDQAWADTQEHIFSMMGYYGEILKEANDAPGDDQVWTVERAEDVRHSSFGKAVMIGTPDQVAKKLERFRKEFTCTHFVMGTQLPGMDPKKGTRALELFAKEVMPAFRK
jgi:alkanesulfonate monooxygenase SsuD/methylene tetrahydromethanopterin reductase-like flavin-dependent oxidoreductase (luciferase family)